MDEAGAPGSTWLLGRVHLARTPCHTSGRHLVWLGKLPQLWPLPHSPQRPVWIPSQPPLKPSTGESKRWTCRRDGPSPWGDTLDRSGFSTPSVSSLPSPLPPSAFQKEVQLPAPASWPTGSGEKWGLRPGHKILRGTAQGSQRLRAANVSSASCQAPDLGGGSWGLFPETAAQGGSCCCVPSTVRPP